MSHFICHPSSPWPPIWTLGFLSFSDIALPHSQLLRVIQRKYVRQFLCVCELFSAFFQFQLRRSSSAIGRQFCWRFLRNPTVTFRASLTFSWRPRFLLSTWLKASYHSWFCFEFRASIRNCCQRYTTSAGGLITAWPLSPQVLFSRAPFAFLLRSLVCLETL